MPEYEKFGFRNPVVDRFQNDTIPPTYKRFNVPLYTGPNPGTKKDSTSYQKGFRQGVENFLRGNPNAIGLLDANNFYSAGRKDGVDAAKNQKNKKR